MNAARQTAEKRAIQAPKSSFRYRKPEKPAIRYAIRLMMESPGRIARRPAGLSMPVSSFRLQFDIKGLRVILDFKLEKFIGLLANIFGHVTRPGRHGCRSHERKPFADG